MTYPLTYRPVFGLNEYISLKTNYSLVELLKQYELGLYKISKQNDDVIVLDVNIALEKFGKNENIEEISADGVYEHFSRKGSDLVTEHLVKQISVYEKKIQRIKCAIFDLDNTIWSGILREDGPQGVHVRTNYLSIMKHLSTRGILIGICSKNDDVEIKHLPSLLSNELYEKLSVKYLNWEPKSLNLKKIADQLNIGLDSIAFFDDNPFERSEVTSGVPDVLVLSDKDILNCLNMIEFQPYGGKVSKLSSERVKQYAQQEVRRKEEEKYKNISYDKFLESCNLKIEIRKPVDGEISRVSELIQRSNQLNATLNRSIESDIINYNKSSNYQIFIANLQDRFGDYGLIGCIIIKKLIDAWEIIEFSFSCRAMSKGVEKAVLSTTSNEASKVVDKLIIKYIKTERNSKVREILSDCGFVCHEINGDEEIMERPLSGDSKSIFMPKWFQII